MKPSSEESAVASKTHQEVYSFGYRKPRFRTNFRVLLQVSGFPPKLIDALCIDISEDGIAAEVIEDLALGTRLTVVMTPPESSVSVRVSAKVVNRNDHHYGFTFHFSSATEREELRGYLASIRPEPVKLSRPLPEPAIDPNTKR